MKAHQIVGSSAVSSNIHTSIPSMMRGGSIVRDVTMSGILYRQHWFLNSATLQVLRPIVCDAVLVGGGGGGGGSFASPGGGGAGGRVIDVFDLELVEDQVITVGAHGSAGFSPNYDGAPGSTTSLGSIISATGGGYGGGVATDSLANPGGDGWNSGGSAGDGTATQPPGICLGGYVGGTGKAHGTAGYRGGGGGAGAGGAGGAPLAGSNGDGGDGGVGLLSAVTGEYYGGGGAGACHALAGSGAQGLGVHGGGNGAWGNGSGGNTFQPGSAGTPNTGGGGGGSNKGPRIGYDGGSGLLVIRYRIA